MLENDGAQGAVLDDEDDKAGSGAPAGGSPDGGSGNDGSEDDEFVPAGRLKAALASQKRHYEGQLSNLRAEFEAFKSGAGTREKPADTPKRFTRAELNQAVANEQISQAQADEIWETQTREQVREDARQEARQVAEASRRAERVETDIASYKRLAPEVMDQGSETRDRVVEEYNYLTRQLGAPQSIETELAAMRAVLGPLDRLERAKSVRRPAEGHQESGAGGEGRAPKRQSKKLVDQLTPREKEHYDRGIKAGRYKDWDAVEAELQFANPALRAKLGARG